MGLRTSAFIVGVLLLDCSLCTLRKPPLLPSSFSPHEQAAVEAAWTAIDHRRCTNWSNGFHYNVSVVLFPSCLPSSPWNKDADEKKGCIPRIVHQTWKTKEPPPRWQSLVESCRHTNPSFVHLVWTDVDSREFIAREHRWFLPTFDDYKFPIQRADAIRYFILRDFGGVYLDMDYECHAPFDQVLDKFAAPIGLVTPKHSNEPTPNGVFSNSMMISATNVHFFWDTLVKELPRMWKQHKGMWYEHRMVLSSTGPRMVQNFLRSHSRLGNAVCAMLKPKFTRCSQCDGPQCECGDCVTLHRYSGSWRGVGGHLTHAWDCNGSSILLAIFFAGFGISFIAFKRRCRRSRLER